MKTFAERVQEILADADMADCDWGWLVDRFPELGEHPFFEGEMDIYLGVKSLTLYFVKGLRIRQLGFKATDKKRGLTVLMAGPQGGENE